MFHYVYCIESARSSKLYLGYTTDLKERLVKHNRGLTRSTKLDKPWKYIYVEACLNKDDARRREHYLKTSQGMRLLKRRLKEYFHSRKTA